MITFRRPCPKTLARFLAQQQEQPVSYSQVEMTRGTVPSQFTPDHTRRALGIGDHVYQRACDAIRLWTPIAQPWIQLTPADVPPAIGNVVAITARIGICWWTNACRVLYIVSDEPPTRRFGFAYGTLADHAECGEERFMVEQTADGQVWYDVLAYSRPRHLLARLGYPMTRMYQKRFARGSAEAMVAFAQK